MATSSDQTSISESNMYKRQGAHSKEKPIKPYVNTQEDKRTTVDTRDNQVLNQTFRYNIDKEDQFSFSSQKELKDQIRQLQKRIEKEEDQNRETMRVLKLIQEQTDHQEDENEQFRLYYSDLKTRVFTLEQKCQNNSINLSDLQEKPKALLERDIKDLGKEMAMDILNLSKKMDSKEKTLNKKFDQMDQEMKKTKQKLYKLLEKERKKISQQKLTELRSGYPSSQLNEEKQKQIKDIYGDIMKKLENLSREVHLQSKRPSKKNSSKYGTNETDLEYNKKETKIMEKINKLESDLIKIKGNNFLTQNSNNYNQLSLSADFGTLSPENNSFVKRCPSFSKNQQDQYTVPVSEGRSLSKSAQRLQNSLEKRMSDFGESKVPKRNHPTQQISKRESRRPYKDVMNISFSSTSSDYYYETGKSQLQELHTRQRVKSGSKSRRSKSKNRSTAKKVNSAHRKSFDDFIRVEVRKKTQTQRHTRKPSQTRDLNMTGMAKRKELEMLDRAKRMVNLASLNILQQEIRRRSASASLRKKKAPSRRKSQQNQSNNILLQNLKQNLMKPNILPQTLKDPLLKGSMSSNMKDVYFRKTMM